MFATTRELTVTGRHLVDHELRVVLVPATRSLLRWLSTVITQSPSRPPTLFHI